MTDIERIPRRDLRKGLKKPKETREERKNREYWAQARRDRTSAWATEELMPMAVWTIVCAVVVWFFGTWFWPLWLLAFPAGRMLLSGWRQIFDAGDAPKPDLRGAEEPSLLRRLPKWLYVALAIAGAAAGMWGPLAYQAHQHDKRLVQIYCSERAHCVEHLSADYVREGRTPWSREAMRRQDAEDQAQEDACPGGPAMNGGGC